MYVICRSSSTSEYVRKFIHIKVLKHDQISYVIKPPGNRLHSMPMDIKFH